MIPGVEPSASPGKPAARPTVIGLTGSIAAGKSTIGMMLAERGAELIDADRVYHALVTPGAPLTGAIVDRFGPGVLCEDGALDRGRLGEIVFGDPALLHSLDRLTHPAVVQEVKNIIAHSTAAVVVVEAVKLAQSELIDDVDELWLIEASEETRRNRLAARGGLSEQAAQARIEATGAPLPPGVVADLTIDTSGGLSATESAVGRAWYSLFPLSEAR